MDCGATFPCQLLLGQLVGLHIAERINIPKFYSGTLLGTIGDFFFDGCWYLEESFIITYTDIIKDILGVHVAHEADKMIWG